MSGLPPSNSTADPLVVHIDPDLEAIVPGFLDNRRRDLTVIDTCLAQGDIDTIRTLGHRMKGDGGGYGFPHISAIGGALEQAALSRDLPAMQAQRQALQDFLARVSVVYRS